MGVLLFAHLRHLGELGYGLEFALRCVVVFLTVPRQGGRIRVLERTTWCMTKECHAQVHAIDVGFKVASLEC